MLISDVKNFNDLSEICHTIEKIGKWESIENKLPPYYKEVFVYCRDSLNRGAITTAYLDDWHTWVFQDYFMANQHFDILYWAPCATK